MRPTKLQRKTALLIGFCEKRGFFSPDQESRNQKSNELGVSKNTLNNWLEEKGPNESKLRSVSANLCALLKPENPTYDFDDPKTLLDRVGVMELGYLMGLSRADCRLYIDQKISSVMPTFGVFCLSRDVSRDTWSDFSGLEGGHYIGYRMETSETAARVTGRKTSIMRIPLSIRHELTGNKFMSRNYFKIKAKTHIYSIRDRVPYFEYDGYITPRDSAGLCHWLFQSRKQNPNDILYLIMDRWERTSVGPSQERLFILGSMHSRCQDIPASPNIWPVVFEKVDIDQVIPVTEKNKPEGWDKFDDQDSFFLKSFPALLDPAEIDPEIKKQMLEANDRIAVSKFDL
ncbi:MAG: hypothetical protein MI743_20735 [Sneathiellales bacterium]|nr:hypothetical protein [Sneathiellales bacterium]